jgi:hypothetical protein
MAAERICEVGSSFMSLSWCKNQCLWKTGLDMISLWWKKEEQKVIGEYFVL